MMTYDEAVAHIERWYRYGERSISVTRQTYLAYAGGMLILSRWTHAVTPPDAHGRQFAAYKAARVYCAEPL